MKHIGLFEGIGGFSLAARWAGWKTVAWCEWNPFCQTVLKHHFPKAEGFGDINKTDFSKYENAIDILTGGFPCQGFSLAGKRLGTDDARYLWPQMLRTIEITRPTWVVGENVTGILSMEDKSGVWKEIFPRVENRKIVRYNTVDHYEAIYTRQAKMLVSTICENLEEIGYEVQPIAIPAASVGAPHIRERIWFVGYSKHNGLYAPEIGRNDIQSPFETGSNKVRKSKGANSLQSGISPHRPNAGTESMQFGGQNGVYGFEIAADAAGELQQRNESGKCGSTGRKTVQQKHGQADSKQSGTVVENGYVANTCRPRWQQLNFSKVANRAGHGTGMGNEQPGNWANFPTQSPLCGRDDGFSSRLDGITFPKWRNESIKAYGNAIVPQVAYQIFKAIAQYENP